MPDTGAPWNIPYVEPTDNPRVYPAVSEDLADAIADGLDAAGGLVAVKHVIKTDTFVEASVASGASVAVTGLSITHEVADPANRLLLWAGFGAFDDTSQTGRGGITIAEGATLLFRGDADGSRNRLGSGGWGFGTGGIGGPEVANWSIHGIHTPGSGSKTYTVHAQNAQGTSQTLYVNRSNNDANDASYSRTASYFTLMEVKV